MSINWRIKASHVLDVFQKRLNCMRIISQSYIIGRDNGLADQEINYPDELVE